MYMKSGGGLGPAAPLCHGRCETDGVGGTDGEDSSELRQGQEAKPGGGVGFIDKTARRHARRETKTTQPLPGW